MSGDPFDILGLPPAFDLLPEQIRKAHLARTATVHPDVSDAQASALAAINHARRILDDPESRAAALLSRLGGPAKEHDRSLPQGFLERMMGVQEELESAAGPADKARWSDWARAERDGHIARVTQQFAALNAAPSAAALADIRRELNAWRYIERLTEQLHRDEGP